MPELPEVEYVRRLLRPAMEGARFVRVLARRKDLRYPFPKDFASVLQGQTVRALTRRAKYLLAELSSGDVLLMHLGMSGWFTVVKGTPDAIEKHDHVVFEMSSGKTVVYNDPRRFGFMQIVDVAHVAVGPEPLDHKFTAAVLASALHGKKTTLKAALLDQKVVGGLGNIYVCEALHRARLSPKRQASTIVTATGKPTPKAVALVAAIKETLRDAIDHRHRADGDDRFLVYDHAGQRCPRRGCAGFVTRILQSGRSTFYCPTCQR